MDEFGLLWLSWFGIDEFGFGVDEFVLVWMIWFGVVEFSLVWMNLVLCS